MIDICNLTKQYRSGEGIFDISFSVDEGEVFGYLGPNGAGKTTTIRHLLGFLRPDEGCSTVAGLDCREQAEEIQRFLGYVPEESAFFPGMTGTGFLDFMGRMRGNGDDGRRADLLKMFELDADRRIAAMSKGMRQKLALVVAFMHDPQVYILDEPTAGLDPLMQETFVRFILEEKKHGKTILMSSHRFEEVERTCDRAGIIRDGRLEAVEDVRSLRSTQRRVYLVTVASEADVKRLTEAGFPVEVTGDGRVEVTVSGDYDHFIDALADCTVLGLDVRAQTLEEIFMKYYGGEE